jgi:hypothetical protein
LIEKRNVLNEIDTTLYEEISNINIKHQHIFTEIEVKIQFLITQLQEYSVELKRRVVGFDNNDLQNLRECRNRIKKQLIEIQEDVQMVDSLRASNNIPSLQEFESILHTRSQDSELPEVPVTKSTKCVVDTLKSFDVRVFYNFEKSK